MNTYSILCPTRSRAGRCKTYADSIFQTATNPEWIELLLYVDSDDPQKANYQSWTQKHPHKVVLVIGEPISVSKSWNIIAEKATGNILMLGNDDLVHESVGWDAKLDTEIAKFPDQIFCIWVNDKHKGEKLCTFPAISRKWYETVGYFSPGIFEFFYHDSWIQDIGQRVDRLHYVPDVIIEHRHWSYGYANDETTKRHRQGEGCGRSTRDSKIFKDNTHLREEAAERLRKVMQ